MKIEKLTHSALLAGAMMAPAAVEASTPAPKEESRPNIILIMTDQQTASAMSCAGNPDLLTPAMDALAEDGVRLERAYCPFPLSGPCRASMMTGLMPTEIGATDNGIQPDEEAMSRSIGYSTKTIFSNLSRRVKHSQRHPPRRNSMVPMRRRW